MRRLMKLIAVLMILSISSAVCETADVTAQPITAPGSGDLRISELMASNGETIEDSFGNTADWIELVNAGTEPFDLTGVFLSDTKKDLQRFQFPDGLILKPGEYLLIFASGLKKNVADELHTSFKLSAAGEALFLTRGSTLLDSVTFGAQMRDVSYALTPDGEYEQTITPTPGEANIITALETSAEE